MLKKIRKMLLVSLSLFFISNTISLSNSFFIKSVDAEEFNKSFQNYMGTYKEIWSYTYNLEGATNEEMENYFYNSDDFLAEELPDLIQIPMDDYFNDVDDVLNELSERNTYSTYRILNDSTFFVSWVGNSKSEPIYSNLGSIDRQLTNNLFINSDKEDYKEYFYFDVSEDLFVIFYVDIPKKEINIDIYDKTFDSPYSDIDFDNLNYEEYESFDYTDIMRDRDGLRNSKVVVTGEVLQYEEDEDNPTKIKLLIMEDSDPDRIFKASFKLFPNERLVQGDYVTIYGDLRGLDNYTTVSGTNNTIPTISIDKHLVEGIDY